MSQPRMDPKTAQRLLTEHPHYKYRGCAPHPDQPGRAAGNRDLPVTSWEDPDLDGGEEPAVRRARQQAAVEVCVNCPVMVQCLAYGSSITADGKLAEQHAVLGGMTSLERHKAFIATRTQAPPKPAPAVQLRTEQKLAVLRALAVHTDPYAVARAAGMDVRTANWQRSILVGKLGLPRTASRRELLAAAVARNLLDSALVVDDDGAVPAVPPPTRQEPAPAATLFPPHAASTAGPDREHAAPPPADVGPYEPTPVRSPRRDRFTAITGQLSIDDIPDDPGPAPALITQLPARPLVLEAAAA